LESDKKWCYVTDALLVAEGVSKSFGSVRAVDGATIDVTAASVTALIGPNGAGKSSLFNVVTGFERPERGRIIFDGRSIYRLPPHAIAQRGLVRTFQLTKILSVMTVIDNMLLAAKDHPGERLFSLVLRPFASRRRERAVRQQAVELLDRFDLGHVANDYAGTLSGGQRKLLELARALMLEPRLVLLDEPLAGVNPALGQRLLSHIEELREKDGTTFLFVEHNMDVVMNHSDRVIVMSQGKVIADGAPYDLRDNERVIEAYLGT
jgi:neutral amino acid transport system ATP-binding protein